MPVTSAISLRPDIRGLRSIGVQRKLPWQCTSDDEHSVCRSKAHRLPTERTGTPLAGWLGRHPSAEWTGRIKC
jgi:hypothetical protein